MSELTAIQNVTAKAVSDAFQYNSPKPLTVKTSEVGASFKAMAMAVPQGKPVMATASDVAKPLESDELDSSKEVMQKFEAMVASQLFGTMLKTMSGDTFGQGMSGDIYKSMFADALGEQIAKHGGFGIAELGMNSNAARLAK
ncbi:MAG: rod-binding protein [Rhizobiaceae bacterium]|nr:rod-binding protein [Rhizobiaceae bacterium]